MKMNQRVKKLWVEALLSREYKKGTGTLREARNKFCCLGVLCNLHAQEHPEIARKELDWSEYLGSSGTLPKAVRAWAGLDDADPEVKNGKGFIRPLSSWNDNVFKSFSPIAKLIDKNL